MPHRRMAAFHSDSRYTKAAFSDRNSLAIARPRWRGEAEKAQRLVAERSELERHPCRDDDRRAFGRDCVGLQLFHTGFRFSTNAEMPSWPSGATALREIASAIIS